MLLGLTMLSKLRQCYQENNVIRTDPRTIGQCNIMSVRTVLSLDSVIRTIISKDRKHTIYLEPSPIQY